MAGKRIQRSSGPGSVLFRGTIQLPLPPARASRKYAASFRSAKKAWPNRKASLSARCARPPGTRAVLRPASHAVSVSPAPPASRCRACGRTRRPGAAGRGGEATRCRGGRSARSEVVQWSRSMWKTGLARFCSRAFYNGGPKVQRC